MYKLGESQAIKTAAIKTVCQETSTSFCKWQSLGHKMGGGTERVYYYCCIY